MKQRNKRLLITTQAVDLDDPLLGFFHTWIEEFATNFETVFVVCLRKGRHTLPANVVLLSLGKEEGKNRFTYVIRFYQNFSRVFFQHRVDYVFFHMGAVYNILAAPFFFLRKQYKTIFFWWKAHGHINLVGRIASLFVDSIYSASKESFPLAIQKRKIIGHAISVPESIIPSEASLKENVRIACINRVSRRKKLEVAIELAQILEKADIPFTMNIIGPAVDPEYMNELLTLVKKYSLSHRVSFTGAIPHHALFDVYKKIDVLLHPSETGSIDKVVLEAMSEGVVPIALCAAYGELIAPYNLCVSENSAEQYYKKIIPLLKMTLDEYNHLRNMLHTKVAKEHSLKTLTERIFNAGLTEKQ